MNIGVIALQGAFVEHQKALARLGVSSVLVKRRQHLAGLDGLIIPGGESTSIGRLMREYDLLEPIRDLAQHGMPMLGTCAGMIILAKRISGGEEPHVAVMDVEVARNSFGRQRESFEADLDIPVLGSRPFPAVFIRAPHIVSVGPNVEVLATYQDRIVAVQEGHLLALSFHPELTDDDRIHAYFLDLVG
ncbi:pyridoxal 5'-phosphate synthase subunit PdxT [Alicyclobacillus cellulosilyticus]|uniref:Pyridoxal 5'-phosphate synthase subunit PdxT n=1 Tax=Alicyclobacillus cellulosilyticus TaxID=1003997 RepID=A0A917KDM5_9BACL|nr:pyridoxal 5'-phosphate synthase glutaminase subunit PdxT [Alicyclobacillus cellulosilyticus]GGJ07135.1 pyridoxal 5'-phosphate synthase subunit PdxT [Alicyclobacillus cellulosilyticus]